MLRIHEPRDEPLTPDQLEFTRAMQWYLRQQPGRFPTWADVLEVVRALGYRKATEGQRPERPPSE